MADSSTISVLIADDSILMRTVLYDALDSEPGITVVGSAKDGKKAVEMSTQLKPDVIIMDIQMPYLDGVSATKDIVGSQAEVPAIIIFSSLTRDDADLVVSCMEAGAFSCVHKPDATSSVPNVDVLKKELSAEIRTAAKSNRSQIPKRIPKKANPPFSGKEIPLVIIGASTGGPPVLHELFMSIKQPPAAAFIVVQHMPERFTKSLAERLNNACILPVKEAQDGDIINAGAVYVAPGNYHLELHKSEDGRLIVETNQKEKVHALRPSIDVTMLSAAKQDLSLTGVILTGMGSDGAEGMKAIKEVGGQTIVQTPPTCVVDGMVQSTIDLGAADHITEVEKIMPLVQVILKKHEAK